MATPTSHTAIPESHKDLFQKKTFAHLGLALKDGSMLVNPVWCALDGEEVLINSAEGRLKDRIMRREPRVTLCLSDPENPYRYLEIRGRITEITTEGAEADIDCLAKHYMEIGRAHV